MGLGDGGHKDLAQAIRVHGNFVEYVPFALLLLLLVEMQHDSVWPVHILGGLLVAGRVLHAAGLSRSSNTSFGRFFGTLLTWAMMLAVSLLALLPNLGVAF